MVLFSSSLICSPPSQRQGRERPGIFVYGRTGATRASCTRPQERSVVGTYLYSGVLIPRRRHKFISDRSASCQQAACVPRAPNYATGPGGWGRELTGRRETVSFHPQDPILGATVFADSPTHAEISPIGAWAASAVTVLRCNVQKRVSISEPVVTSVVDMARRQRLWACHLFCL